ncbi:hypothetical protein J6590_037658, partial [Homalodisca vitripennis]
YDRRILKHVNAKSIEPSLRECMNRFEPKWDLVSSESLSTIANKPNIKELAVIEQQHSVTLSWELACNCL